MGTLRIFDSASEAAQAMAKEAAAALRAAIERGVALGQMARLGAATGASQIEFLNLLSRAEGIDWTKVELFHLDEYVGLAPSHPATFHRYVRERLVEPNGIRVAHLIDGAADVAAEVRRVSQAIAERAPDLLFAGIGENGHLAFNEPPADFATEAPYLRVPLAERTRRQQVGEGWFATLDEVPREAITMSICQILKARKILVIATGARKAEAVRACFGRAVTQASVDAPASVLREHGDATVFLDRAAAGGLIES